MTRSAVGSSVRFIPLPSFNPSFSIEEIQSIQDELFSPRSASLSNPPPSSYLLVLTRPFLLLLPIFPISLTSPAVKPPFPVRV